MMIDHQWSLVPSKMFVTSSYNILASNRELLEIGFCTQTDSVTVHHTQKTDYL